MPLHTLGLVCAGCGRPALPVEQDPYPFRCRLADAGDDTDHLMTWALDTATAQFPRGAEANPFLRYRQLLYPYNLARARGVPEEEYTRLVQQLDHAIAEVDGHGFVTTPFSRNAALSARLDFSAGGGVWVKDETHNVAGSHKARHLFGIMLYLRVLERLGLARSDRPDLAIASCGNAALAAAVVARGADRPLEVFIPPSAEPAIVDRLQRLGAHLTVCPREDGIPGDPCYHRFREAVARGALPFCCQGRGNGLTIDGGKTLAYEMIAALADTPLERFFVQVGGGALASACIQAFADGVRLGRLVRVPRFHAVQTRGAFPLKRAYDRLVARILSHLKRPEGQQQTDGPSGDRARAELIKAHASSPVVREAMRYAATHRSEFMWPWEAEPHSIASGILDDETYDWLAVVEGMLLSGGYPVVVDEALLIEANTLARHTTGIDVDHTGSAGLAGLLGLLREGECLPEERVAVIFTGVRR